MEKRLRKSLWKPAPVAMRPEPEDRKRLSGPALRAFFPIAAAWALSVVEQRALLGWPAASTFHKYKGGSHGTLSFDTLTRLSLILGIYKALQLLYPDPSLADAWVRLPNTNEMFGGKPPLTLMIDDGIDGLYRVRRLLDGRRG
jgi:hypothetical protein